MQGISNSEKIIPIEAEVIRVATTKDGAFRVTLDIPNYNKKVSHFLADKAVDNETMTFVIIDDAQSLEVGENNGQT